MTISFFDIAPLVVKNIANRVEISWHWPAANLSLIYLLSAGLSNIPIVQTGFAKPIRFLLKAMGVIIIIAFAGASLISKFYWGYFYQRPALPEIVYDFKKIDSLISVGFSEIQSDGTIAFVIDKSNSIQSRIDFCKKYGDECYDKRILVALEKMRLLPSSFSQEHAAPINAVNIAIRHVITARILLWTAVMFAHSRCQVAAEILWGHPEIPVGNRLRLNAE